MSLPRNNKLNKNAKFMRKNMTSQERRLWYEFLRNYPINVYRQRIIGNYIVDFYCKKAKLVIELDGSQDFEEHTVEKDKLRTAYLQSLGLKVLRFSNHELDSNFDAVCQSIDSEIKARNVF